MLPIRGQSAPDASSAAETIDRLYDAYAGILQRMLVRSFGIDGEDGLAIIAEAFVALITARPADPEAWLIAGVYRAAIEFRRRRGTEAHVPRSLTAEELRHLQDAGIVRSVLATLPEPAKRAMLLRFAQRRSYAEIAEELGIATQYAKRLVREGFVRIREEQRRRDAERGERK
jgi:RNA polymerase sigma factor (sigma-70 family)